MVKNHHHFDPAVFAREIGLIFDPPVEMIALTSTLEDFLSDLSSSLKLKGCTLIGHIKGLIAAGEKGHLVFSVTSFKESPRFNGEIRNEIYEALLTINIIVYGVDAATVDAVFHESFQRHLSKIIGG